jgi:hypothetical protein
MADCHSASVMPAGEDTQGDFECLAVPSLNVLESLDLRFGFSLSESGPNENSIPNLPDLMRHDDSLLFRRLNSSSRHLSEPETDLFATFG